ncbi:AraC family transcriptional regulator [Neorhizobium sp. T786]|uniref:AraC family transcriptional regulator n=1 Tax=Pseudorhizobium xiangyangii TaxID=2883104 RepID=UPI001CFFA3CE|nr:AraC family transcriptional regulator [Neorhizobium xiangyangii]MCB5201298.1 AraC family transcriptional regulator [Neorhizobium xiangyangii]
MSNRIGGFKVVGKIHRRQWNGITADLTQVECETYAGGYYVAQDPRLFILLDAEGEGRPLVKMSSDGSATPQDTRHRPISFVPAGMDLWVDVIGVRSMRHLDLHFDAEVILQRLGADLDPKRLEDAHLLFSDERIVALGQLIAAECANPQPLHDLYGDSLAMGLIIDVMKLGRSEPRQRSALASWQLRRALDFIEGNCLRNIRLEELASLTGLSQSHFSRAFKASTGTAPHQWQMKMRIKKAQQMLASNDGSLSDVAAETGFSDQAHFTRIFRQLTGTTPSHWRRAQK